MGIIFNGEEFNELYYNSNQVGKVEFNGDTIWKYAPAVPTFSIRIINDTNLELRWDSLVRDAVRYRIDYGTTSSFGQSLTTQNASSYTFNGLTPNTKYYFRLRAEGVWDNSAYTATQSDTTPPAKPVGFAGSTWDTDSIYLTWTASTGADRYYIDRKQGSGNWASVTYSTTNSYTNNGLSVGTSYSYRIRAYSSANGFSNYSAVVTASTGTIPSTTSLSTVPDLTSISLSWIKVSGADGYQLQRSTSSNSGFSTVATISSGSTVSYNNTGLSSGTKYYYRIRAFKTYSGDDAYSSWSSVVNVTTLFQIATPGGLSLSNSENQITASWNNVADETGFLLEIATNSAFTANLQNVTLGANVTTHTFTGLSYETAYYVRIKANGLSNVSVDSAYSSHATITTEAEKLPTPSITNLRLSDDYDAFYWNYELNFEEVSSPANRIEHEWSDSSTFSNILWTSVESNRRYSGWPATDVGPLTTISTYNSTAGLSWRTGVKTIYVRIRALDSTGVEKTSNWSNVVSVDTPANVANAPTVNSINPIGTTGGDATIILNDQNEVKNASYTQLLINGIKVEYSTSSSFSSSATISDLYTISSRTTSSSGYSSSVYYWASHIVYFNINFPVLNQTYYIRFKAVNSNFPECDSPWSSTATFQALRAANTPSATSTGNTTEKVVVNITGSSGSNEYFQVDLYEDKVILQADDDAAASESVLASTTVRASGSSATAEFYASDGVLPGMTYYAKVRQVRGSTYSVSPDFLLEEILTPHPAPSLISDKIKWAQPIDSSTTGGDYTYVSFALNYNVNFSSDSLAKYGANLKGTSGSSWDLLEAPIVGPYSSIYGAFNKMGVLYEDYDYSKRSIDISYSTLNSYFTEIENSDSIAKQNNDAATFFTERYNNEFQYKKPYTVQVATDLNFTNIVYQEDILTLTAVELHNIIQPGVTYYMRARTNPIPVRLYRLPQGEPGAWIRRRIGGTSSWSTTYSFIGPIYQSIKAKYYGGSTVNVYIDHPARVTINWGDGSLSETIEATSDKVVRHVYGATDSTTYDATIEGVAYFIGFREPPTLENADHGLKEIEWKDDSSSYTENNKANNLIQLFENCRRLNSVSLLYLDTSLVTSCYKTFENCVSLVSIGQSSDLVKANCTNINRCFYGCTSLAIVYFTNWETTKLTNLSETFKNCTNLSTLRYASGNFYIYKNTSAGGIVNTISLFENCYNLNAADLAFCNTNFNMHNAWAVSAMFKNVGQNWNEDGFGELDLTTMVGTFTSNLLVHWDFIEGKHEDLISVAPFPTSSCNASAYCWL